MRAGEHEGGRGEPSLTILRSPDLPTSRFHGDRTRHAPPGPATFDSRLEFTIRLLPYDGNDGWVEGTLREIRETLSAPEPPKPDTECEYCEYISRGRTAWGQTPGKEQ